MHRSAELPNLVLAAIGAGTWDMDVAGGMIRHNSVLADLAGFKDGLLERPLSDFMPCMDPEEAKVVMQKLQSAIEHGTPYSSIHRIFRPDGSFSWLQDLGRVIERDATGKATRMVGAARDITDEVHIRQRLQETEAFFGDLVQNVPGAILRFALQADGQAQQIYASPRCADIWEVSQEEILADNGCLRRMLDPDDRARLLAAFVAFNAADARLDIRGKITTPSGRRKQLHFFGRPSARREKAVIWTVVVIDITAQARLEEELQRSREIILQTQKMEAIGSLTGGMAHDFNNLLAVILGNLELLQDDPASPSAADYVQDAIDAALRGGELTRSLLSFARKAPLAPVRMDLNEVVRGMDSMIRRTLPENIRLENVAMGGLWPILADRSSTESAVLNLVINARDAMPVGGKITIETANIRLTEDYAESHGEPIEPGRYVMLAVTDTGTGIPTELLDRIFEPFFTTKPVGHGTGLGLASIMGFAKQSGGTVQVYSELGVGTTFKIYFRAAIDEGPLASLTQSSASDFTPQRGRVLLVEDNPAVRKVMKSRLQIEGFQVSEASNAEAAIHAFEVEGGFDLILTDIVMSGTMHGTGLVKELRKRDPNLRAIFMSGYPNEAAIHGNGLSVEDIKLTKPVGRDDLHKALAKVFGTS